MKINPVKGTHDIYSSTANDALDLEYTFNVMAMAYGYEPIVIPTLEHTNLFQRSVGESSDIVTKEMYTFLDKAGRSLTLRPEFTAGIMRAVVTNKLYVDNIPLRLFYNGSCFRYERPQAGRYREFHQMGVELIAPTNPGLDAEVIALGFAYLKEIGLNPILKINYLPAKDSREKYLKDLKAFFEPNLDNMCEDCKRRYEINPLRILDCKVPSDREIIEKAPSISTYLSDDDLKHYNEIKRFLGNIGISYEEDDRLVRGLDYYSGIVFEYYFDTDNSDFAGIALGGGGHYDGLLQELDGPSEYSGVGLSFGLERLISAYQNADTEYKGTGMRPIFYMAPLSEEGLDLAHTLATFLHENSVHTILNYEIKSLKSFLKSANKKQARNIIIIGEDELKKGFVTIKNLESGVQHEVAIDDFPEIVFSILKENYEDDDGEIQSLDITKGN